MDAIYSGEFVSREGNVLWRVEILGTGGGGAAGELEFPSEEPLLIEWCETGKEEVVCGSTATLKIISPGDRTYVGLYSIAAGSIGLAVYREEQLYWLGTLDPEFYEEPYTDAKDYEVELTFSDFGILERLQYNLSGLVTLEQIVRDGLQRAKLGGLTLDETLISTRLTSGGGTISLGSLSLRSENFTDEDGETVTVREAIEGALQPLGLRMVQKNGKVWVYDLNGLYQGGGSNALRWHDDDQTLGVDKVANEAVITFSPYASDGKLLTGDFEYPGDATVTNDIGIAGAREGYPPSSDLPLMYYPSCNVQAIDNRPDYQLMSFALFGMFKWGQIGELAEHDGGLFKIVPLRGGEECEGIAWLTHSGWSGNRTVNTGNGGRLMKTSRVYVPALGAGDRGNYWLRLEQEILLDVRYNPFSDPKDNYESQYNHVKARYDYVFIDCQVVLHGDDASTWSYDNAAVTQSHDKTGRLDTSRGSWVSGSAGHCWLSWYDPGDRAESSGVLGWKKNRPNIGISTSDIYESFKTLEGEYIPYPPTGGYVEVTIYNGVRPYDFGQENWNEVDKFGYLSNVKWLLYKLPKLTIVDNTTTHEAVATDDVEYKGTINAAAKDPIEIDTTCGTLKTLCPTAKGVYRRTSDLGQVLTMSRAGRTTQVEQLLIGTLHSQFAERHAKLQGTAFLLNGDLGVVTEACQGGRKFIVLGDLQDVDAGTSEVVAVELSPDEYTAS